MSAAPPFDLATAHRWFAADCFNRVWDLLDKPDRNADDDERMISLCRSSLAHWQDHPECTARNLSVGWWQLARVHAVLGQGEPALHAARICLEKSQDEPPFYLGYAHEAMARAAKVLCNGALRQQHLDHAVELAGQVKEAGDRSALETDLATLAG